MSDKEIKMGEFGTAKDPGELIAAGVGSCVVVTLYDPLLRVGGIAHTSASDAGELIDKMLIKMSHMGASRETLEAKLAGGANMFDTHSAAETVGERNIVAAREKLKKVGIRIVAESIGGKQGRSVKFSTRTGVVVVKVIL